MSELCQILAYLIGNLLRITKNTISKVYDPYFLSYSEKTESIPPVTNLAIPPMDGFTVVGLYFLRAKRGELAERTSLRESERAPVQCMGFRTRGISKTKHF